MPLNEFWNDEPNLFWVYRFLFFQKEKRKREFENEKAWLQGAYIYEAVSVALNNAFSKQKIEYRSSPYDIYKDNTEEEEKSKAKRNQLEEQLKARAKKIEGLLGGKENGNG